MIYNISDKPKTVKELLFYAMQQMMSVFVATVLIANICGTPVDACLFGAFLGTLIYQIITKFKSPMFISSCGATVSAVIGALAIGDGSNYLAVTVGGLCILLVYGIFALIVKYKGVEAINKVLPPIIVGPITIVIGINLAGFIGTYVATPSGSNAGVIIAVITMLIIAISSHYFKGFWKTIPFLIGLISGYSMSIIVTLLGIEPLVDFSVFENMKVFAVPDFSFLHWTNGLSLGEIGQVALLFIPVALAALCEHYSDHKVLSNIIGVDLTAEPGLHRTLIGDSVASLVGTITCGLPNTSYGESIATTGFSKVASVCVITTAAAMLGILSFIQPVQVLINSIPSCVFGGCAIILYGYIAASGLKTLISSKADLNDNKNLIVVSAILTVGVSGIFLFHTAFAGVSLAMILGIVLNIILSKERRN